MRFTAGRPLPLFRLAALALCGLGGGPVEAAAQPPARAAAAQPRYAQLDPIFADYRTEKHIPGLVYGIVAGGRLVHVRSFGVQDLKTGRPVTPDTLFRIASMTKAFTALGVLSLRDRGALSLDSPAEAYVPELKSWRYPTADSPRIRVRDLLHHNAGFVTDDPWGDRQLAMPEAEFGRLLRSGISFDRAPGLKMEYSNFGYALLGRIVARASGLPYRTYIERTLLEPLAMRSTGFEVGEWPVERRAIGYRWEDGRWSEEPALGHGAFGAMGGLQTSASDYARFVAWLLSAWPPRDAAEAGPLKRSTIREMVQGSGFAERRERALDGRPCPQSVTYGMGMRVFADCELGVALNHGGGLPGFGSGVLLLPERGVGLFVFGNRTYGGGSEALWRAASVLLKAGLLPDPPSPVSSALAEAHAAARLAYRRGDVLAVRGKLAANFLMDRSAEGWRRDLAAIRAKVGACDRDLPVRARGAMSASFRWLCERGAVDGEILLAPTRATAIQKLQLTVAPPPPPE